MTDFRIVDDVERRFGKLDEVGRRFSGARIANKRGAAAKKKRQADLKAEAQKIMRGEYHRKSGGSVAKAVTDHRRTLEAQRRPNEADAMQQRFADQERRQRRSEAFGRMNETLDAMRKLYGD